MCLLQGRALAWEEAEDSEYQFPSMPLETPVQAFAPDGQLLAHTRLKVIASGFHSDTVSFLRFCLGPGQIVANPKKLGVMVEWPRPSTQHKLQQFLGFANFYRQFIRNYCRLAAPLTRVTSTAKPFMVP